MLLILNVLYNDIIPDQAAKEIHQNRAWASDGLKRYQKGGIEGLKDRTKCDRTTELSEKISFSIKKELSNYKQGWPTKQVEELIIKRSGIKYHCTHISVFFANEVSNKRCQERYKLILHH